MNAKTKDKLLQIPVCLSIFLYSMRFLIKPLGSGDELWNYSFAINISKGYLPYKDFSMVQTPLSAYITGFLLKIFGNKMLVFRIAAVVLFAMTFLIIYFVCLEISHEIRLAVTVTAFLASIVSNVWIYNYNHLNLCLIVLIIYLELNNNIKREYLIDFIYGILPLIKQNTGGVLLISYWVFSIVECVLKQISIKVALKRLLISIIPGIVFIVVLLLNGSWLYFWEYAICGISTFKHRTLIWKNPSCIGMTLFCVMTIVVSLYKIVTDRCCIAKKKHCKILVISIAAGSVAYPLSDFSHCLIATVPYVICFICCFKYKKNSKIMLLFETMCLCILGISFMFAIWIDKDYIMSKHNHFEGIPIEKKFEDYISLIDNSIEEKAKKNTNVIIADESAVAYMIPLDRYTKNFDMLLLGNLGLNTVDDLLNQDSEAEYWIKKESCTFGYQSHFELIQYIRDNYQYVGEVGNFDCYRKED